MKRLLILLSRLSVGLLLRCLLPSFVSPAKSACKAAHGRARSGTLSCIARYCTTDRTKCCTSRSPSQNVRLRGAVRLVFRALHRRLRLARIKTGLANCPGVAVKAIFVLLNLVLPFRRIDIHLGALC